MTKSLQLTDKYVGSMVPDLSSHAFDMSQTKLADALGITFQQVQEIRKWHQSHQRQQASANRRVSAGPVTFFFGSLSTIQKSETGPPVRQPFPTRLRRFS
jgi:hypothetical protein